MPLIAATLSVPAIDPPPDAIDSVYFGPVRVRPGTVFFLGDNRLDSRDSRDYGPVPRSSLIGRVLTTLWPLIRR